MPVLHLLAGPNGAGKSTYVHDVLSPATVLPFINADEIADGSSFISETVFSHPSKIELVGSRSWPRWAPPPLRAEGERRRARQRTDPPSMRLGATERCSAGADTATCPHLRRRAARVRQRVHQSSLCAHDRGQGDVGRRERQGRRQGGGSGHAVREGDGAPGPVVVPGAQLAGEKSRGRVHGDRLHPRDPQQREVTADHVALGVLRPLSRSQVVGARARTGAGAVEGVRHVVGHGPDDRVAAAVDDDGPGPPVAQLGGQGHLTVRRDLHRRGRRGAGSGSAADVGWCAGDGPPTPPSRG